MRNKPHIQGDFTPAAMARPDTIPLLGIRHHHTQCLGGRETGDFPPSSCQGKRNSLLQPKKICRNQSLFFDVSFSIRSDTRFCEASFAVLSRSIRIVSISPSQQPGGRSETGIFTRTDSSSQEINTATVPSIRSTVTFNFAPLQIAGQ